MGINYEQAACLETSLRAIKKRTCYLWLQDGTEVPEFFTLPWREIWCDSDNPKFADKIQIGQSTPGLWPVDRLILPITNDPEESITSHFSYDRLLPVYFLQGLANERLSHRKRRNIRERMLEQLANIRRGTFVVIGSDSSEMWEVALNDIFDEYLLPDVKSIDVILVGVHNVPVIVSDVLKNRKQEVYIWQQSAENLYQAISQVKQKTSHPEHEHQIRVGNDTVGIDDIIVGLINRLDDEYYIIEASDLEEPERIDRELLAEFLQAPDPCWAGFAAGLCFQRHYRPLSKQQLRKKAKQFNLFDEDELKNDVSLVELIERCLDTASRDFEKNITVTIPAEPGSGITTMLWDTAYQMANKGYPVLILKHGTREIDFNALTAFLTDLSRRARETGKDGRVGKEVPVLLVFDVEHQEISLTREIASQLRNDGRFCVVLRAVEPSMEFIESDDSRSVLDDFAVKAWGPELSCKVVSAHVETAESNELAFHFALLTQKYDLDIELPDHTAWMHYQSQQRIQLADGSYKDSESLFWICLNFFVLQQMIGSDRLSEQLTNKMIDLRSSNPLLARYLYSIAVATSFRLALPTRILVHAYNIINWVEFSEDLNEAQNMIQHLTRDYGRDDEEYLRFRHPQFARIILHELYRSITAAKVLDLEFFKRPAYIDYPVEWLHHLISQLEPGIEIHRQFGKLVAKQVLKLEGKRRDLQMYADSLLEAFHCFPSHYIQQNQTVLQANAITLSKSISRNIELTEDEARKRLAMAEEKMRLALDLVNTDNVLDEDPRILKTTLANIYEFWSRKEVEWGKLEKSEQLAEKAALLYNEVVKDWPDSSYARYGYSLLIYNRYLTKRNSGNQENMEDLVSALEYLDTRPEADFEDQWEKHRINILSEINQEKAKNRLQELIDQGMEIGYVLLARSVLGRPEQDAWPDSTIEEAIGILEEAESARYPSNNPNYRISLLYNIVSLHSQRKWDFRYRYRLLTQLKNNGYYLTVKTLYEFAILCYQLDLQEEGDRLFSIMRRGQRYRKIGLENYEYWRENMYSGPEPPVRRAKMVIQSVDSAYNGWARVDGLNRLVPFSPAHPWRGKAIKNTRTNCIIRFRPSGPQAVPQDFLREGM